MLIIKIKIYLYPTIPDLPIKALFDIAVITPVTGKSGRLYRKSRAEKAPLP